MDIKDLDLSPYALEKEEFIHYKHVATFTHKFSFTYDGPLTDRLLHDMKASFDADQNQLTRDQVERLWLIAQCMGSLDDIRKEEFIGRVTYVLGVNE